LSAYADTSFLVSLYTPDANSASAAAQMKRLRTPLFLTPFGEVELLNALELRIFRREITPTEIKAARAAFRDDIKTGVYALTPLPGAAFEKAKEIASRHTPKLGSRTLDILHVATALVLGADTFFSFDQCQRRLAIAVGFRIP